MTESIDRKTQREQERALREQECMERVTALLHEFDCTLIARPQIVDGRIVAVVQLVAK